MRSPWTRERVDKLREGFAKGLSASIIADQIGEVSRNAVIGKLHRLGLLRGHNNPLKLKKKYHAPTREKRKNITDAIRARYRDGIPGIQELKNAIHRQRILQPDMGPLETFKAEPDVARVKSVLDLEPHHCRWPCGEPTDGFCGEKHLPGLPYCERHSQRAYVAVERKRDSILKPKVSAAPWNAKRFLINA